MLNKTNKKQKGFITLISVLVMGTIILTLSLTFLLLSYNSSKNSFEVLTTNQAKGLANTCAEAALQEIRNLTAFTGSNTIILTYGDCDFTVIDNGAENRTIEALGQVKNNIRKVKIIIDQINPTINITSWQEVADF